MADLIRYVDERLANSITALTPVANPIDQNEPLNFTTWLQYNNFLFTNTEDFLARYQSYLNNWFQVTNTTKESSQQIVRQYYVNLINEIVINFATVDEQRYLKNLDLTNPRDAALAIPFFARKIKDVCIYFSTLRDTVTTSVTQSNLRGSNYGIETTLYNIFVRAFTVGEIPTLPNGVLPPLSTIRQDVVIGIEEIYDLYADYYDINPLAPASAYNSTNDLRAQYFTLNQYEIDPDLYLNASVSILRAIFSYPFYSIEIGSGLYLDPAIDSGNLSLLKDSDYTDLVATSSVDALNLSIKAQQIAKYAGADFYYVRTNSTGTAWTSGVLFQAENEYANVLNKRFPTVAAVPSLEYLKTDKEVGLFFKPDKQGVLHFTNFNFTPSINEVALEPNTTYYFPDPYKYGNVSSNTKLTFKTPLVFTEDNKLSKIDFSNGYQFGDSITSPFLQTFRAYQSREQSLDKSTAGISKYIDSQDFFTGDERDIWSNKDVYPIVPVNSYPIDYRQSKLLTLNKTLVQLKTDIYGNEFGLYKEINPVRVYSNVYNTEGRLNAVLTENKPGPGLVLNGHVFKDPEQGYEFDYTIEDKTKRYSGVILKTTTKPPPGYSFRLDELPIQIYSYKFEPELFDLNYVVPVYECNIVDSIGFALPNGDPLPDFSSDSSLYDPINADLYYSILLDGGVTPYAPDYRASFGYQGDFTFMPPESAITLYDAHNFLDSGVDVCLETQVEPRPYNTEFSNFADIRLNNRRTVVDTSLSGIPARKTIYDADTDTYGILYYRNSNSSIIEPASATLSGVFIKYKPEIVEELNNKLIGFDLVYDTLQFETENYLVFEQITFDYPTNTIAGGAAGISVIDIGVHKQYEKVSSVWFIEQLRELIVCKTTLFHEHSATNNKIVFPKIYKYSLDSQSLTQLYPLKRDADLTYNDLKGFSLSGKDIEVNIVEIEKPVITFNDENNQYTMTYLGKDLAGIFYIFNVRFRYIDGALRDISTTMYKTGSDIYTENFGGSGTTMSFETYSVLGSAAGNIDPETGTFTFCGTLPQRTTESQTVELIPPASFTPVQTITGFGSTAKYKYLGFYNWDACVTDRAHCVHEATLPFWKTTGIPNFVDGHVVFAAYNSISAVVVESTGYYGVTHPIGAVTTIESLCATFTPPNRYTDRYGYFAPDTNPACGNETGKKKFSLLSNTYPLSTPGEGEHSVYGNDFTVWFPVTSTVWGDTNTFLNTYGVWITPTS